MSDIDDLQAEVESVFQAFNREGLSYAKAAVAALADQLRAGKRAEEELKGCRVGRRADVDVRDERDISDLATRIDHYLATRITPWANPAEREEAARTTVELLLNEAAHDTKRLLGITALEAELQAIEQWGEATTAENERLRRMWGCAITVGRTLLAENAKLREMATTLVTDEAEDV